MATLFAEDFDNCVDHISKLPNDIVWNFVSPMGMKDAAKTSILSKRWRYIWANQTHLDFNHMIIFPEADPDPFMLRLLEGLKSKYINWVNKVVGLHCGPCIDTFRVRFSFDCSDAHHIDKWLKFALSKKVQNLELHIISHIAVHTIGLDILKPSVGITDGGITCLKSLHLHNIDVSGDFLEYLLSRCCLLERLYVRGSKTLVRLNVVGSSCKLKHLTINYCRNLEELEIDAVNLAYFEYICGRFCPTVEFKSAPVLVEAAFGGEILSGSLFQQITHIAAQISQLYLNLTYSGVPACFLPTFCNLKQLSLLIDDHECPFNLAGIIKLLMACPMLQELKLETNWMYLPEAADELRYDAKSEVVLNWNRFDVKHMEQKSHPNLKSLHVVAFRGCGFEVDIILVVVISACNLETIICDSSSQFPEEEIIEASRSRANKLAKLIPPKINVVII